MTGTTRLPFDRGSWPLAALLLGLAPALATAGVDVVVSDATALRRALEAANPGTRIRVASGNYPEVISVRGLQGTEGKPILVEADDPAHPPVFQGGLQISDAAHVVLDGLAVAGARANGINIDDGGSFDTPSHHVLIRNVTIRDIGSGGNQDGLKLSGVVDFRVENCTLERWGTRGSGIDMVGCHRGEIVGCTFRHGDQAGDNGVQAKGGSREIAVRKCRFEHSGQRAINLGGSTGMAFFRPKPEGFEAKDLTVEDCVFIGSHAPVAFVGVDGAIVRRNTFYRPGRYAIRILQETRDPAFVPSRNGVFAENLIAFRSDELSNVANIGPGTAPETFRVERNAWFCLDAPQRSKPRSEVAEADGRYGTDPGFGDAESGDLRSGNTALKDIGASDETVLRGGVR